MIYATSLRKNYIKNKYNFKLCDDELIKEYFVEIFSWSVINKYTLNDIDTFISKYVPNGTIIDPCSGNSFHTFLFNKFKICYAYYKKDLFIIKASAK